MWGRYGGVEGVVRRDVEKCVWVWGEVRGDVGRDVGVWRSVEHWRRLTLQT